jgi:hypothetical protein
VYISGKRRGIRELILGHGQHEITTILTLTPRLATVR